MSVPADINQHWLNKTSSDIFFSERDVTDVVISVYQLGLILFP